MLTALVLLAAEEKPSGGPDPLTGMLIPIAVMFGLFYFLIIMPAHRKEKQQREELFGKLKKNDEVLTNAGIIAVVHNIKDDEVTLSLEGGAKLRVLKSSIARIINAKDAPAATDNAQNIKAAAPGGK